jgi:hypothetical protein
LREEGRLKVSEIKMLRGIFQLRRDEVIGERRKLHNEKLNDLYCSPTILREIKSRRMRWAGYVAHVGERRGVYRILVGKPEEKTPLERPRHRWEDIVDLQEMVVGEGGIDWVELA